MPRTGGYASSDKPVRKEDLPRVPAGPGQGASTSNRRTKTLKTRENIPEIIPPHPHQEKN